MKLDHKKPADKPASSTDELWLACPARPSADFSTPSDVC
jgi:hypothetical protein